MPTPDAVNDYCARHTSAPDCALEAVYRSVMLHTANPYMASTPYQGAFLQLLATLIQPRVAVEIGSFAGYGGACIARGMGNCGTLHLVESNEEMEPLIWEHVRMSGAESIVRLHIGLAADIIPTLPDGIGLAFVDADKEEYNLYYDLLLPKMLPGGLMVFDNMLWYGRVVDNEQKPEANQGHLRCERETRTLHELNCRITADSRVDNILLPLRDGLMLCRVRKQDSPQML